MTWKEAEDYNRKFLDTLPIEQFMKVNQNISDLMDILQNTYGETLEGDCILQGEVFNHLDKEDFVIYLRHRYNANIYEWVTTTYQLSTWDKENNGTNE